MHRMKNIKKVKQKLVNAGSKLKSPETRHVQERLVSTLEHLQVKNGIGPGVRRGKCHLLTCHYRCKCSLKTAQLSKKKSQIR